MTNANSKFKFKDLCLLAIFRLSTEDKAQVLIKVGKTSAVEFTPSGEHGTDTLTYVYPTNEKKVRLAKDTHVYALNTRLLLSLDFYIDDHLIDDEPNPFKEIPPKRTKGAKGTKARSNIKFKDPGFTAKECARAELDSETEELGPPITENVCLHPHPQPGTEDAGMGNPLTSKVTPKKAAPKPQVKKVAKGRK